LLADDGDTIAFASELPALFESGLDHGGLDIHAISEYFAFGQIPAPRTVFENVRKLQPGELVFIDDSGVTSEQFYTPTIKHREPTFEQAVGELRDRIDAAVERRLMSDVPLGAFLSGGIDSSIVVGTMADLMDEPVRTFTVGFEQSLFDESWAAREVADYHGTDHTEFTVTPQEVRDAIPTVLDRIGEPFADQSLIPSYIISQETSRDMKVALSGDGADELFAGYSKYRGEYYSDYYRRLPEMFRSALIAPAVNSLKASRAGRRGELVRKAQKFLRGDVAEVADRHFAWNRILEDDTHTAFDGIDPNSAGRKRMHEEHAHAEEILPGNRRDELSRILAVDTRFGLPNQILHKTDLASMYSSLEVRVPFLDTAVVEYAMSLPSEYKITRSEQKRVLKEAFEDRLPESILERDKHGFDMPIGEWFKTELATEFRETVTGLDTDLVDTEEVLDIFEDHRTGKGEHGKFLWSVYVFARWHRRMVDAGVLSPEK
jgi:asparagine synthase (glutamine-hydrolysing)